MTTSVFYASNAFGLQQFFPASHARAISNNLTVASTVQQVSANGTGVGDMISGTLTNTPTAGDVIIAVVMRADGQASTPPAGWSTLTSGGTAGSRELDVHWYRSTGIVADKGTFTFTRASGTAAWCIELFGIGGAGACGDPGVGASAGSFASATSVTPTAAVGNTSRSPGLVLTAFVVGGGTISGISGAFSGTGTQESHTTYSNGTFTRGGVSLVDEYSNADYSASPTFGTAWSWTTSRAGHSCAIYLEGAGTIYATSSQRLTAGIGSTTGGYENALGQSYAAFDTSSIPDTNTISSATLKAYGATSAPGISLGSIGYGDPTTATLQARYHGTSLPTNTRGNNTSTPYLSSSAFAAKTLAATFSSSSTWSTSSENTLTSESGMIGSINKTGTTAFVFSTDEYATGSAGSGAQAYAMLDAPTYMTLTVVHAFAGSATVAASLTVTPTLSRALIYARRVASTITSTPVIGQVLAFARTITSSVTTTPTVTSGLAYLRTISATVTATPVIQRALIIGRTIAATLTGTSNVDATYVPFVSQVARVIRLGGRNTIRLTQTVTARLIGRSTIRLPKE